jgi:hypothetical protein
MCSKFGLQLGCRLASCQISLCLSPELEVERSASDCSRSQLIKLISKLLTVIFLFLCYTSIKLMRKDFGETTIFDYHEQILAE